MNLNAHTSATVDEMLEIKRLINLLHADYHNPGAARYIAPTADIDALVDDYERRGPRT